MPGDFYKKVVSIIKQIPKGRIATYGQIAVFADSPGAARQVSWILHSSAEKENLPWHRIINSKGTISVKKGSGYELQKKLLEKEGVVFSKNDTVDFNRYLWNPE